ncbi:MAG: hypothetical protein ABI459_01180 [Deltaproteobacteria bacterium]
MIEENPNDDVLFSAEYFSTFQALEHLPKVAADLREFDFDVRTVMFVRNQVDQLSSLYAQRIKLLNMTLSFDQALRHSKNMDRADWLRAYQSHVAQGWTPHIGAYGRGNKMPIVKAFFEIAGLIDRLPPETDFSVADVNPSFGSIGVLVGLHVSRHLADIGKKVPHDANVYFGRCLIAASAEVGDDRFIGHDASDLAYIRERYAEGNSAIAKLLPDDEADLLLTEKLPEGPTSPRSFSELNRSDFQRAEACMELLRSKMLAYERLHIYLPREMITQIPRIG